ncbi:MAG: LysR family transcriptional regulator [Prevotellaceae bacterium]|jgi:LysR family hydrogen peroxide-inducible transcriptional activator|nr:LysR family transcriptional regulator [Prevotellaceae bacterium]
MTLQQLEYILAVDGFHHFAKAAEHCHVTQPTLSAMIQKLEEELEVKIFDRSQQPVVPTPIGTHIIEQARRVLVESNQVKHIIEEEKHSLSGTFHLGILPSIAPYLLPRFFPQLAKSHPQLDIRVTEMKTADIKQALGRSEIDAGIVANLDDMELFVKTPLLYDQFYGYVSRESPLFKHDRLRTSDLVNQPLWMLDEGHCFRDQLVRFCQLEAARASQQRYRLGSLETFMRMVESGRGITFIPELAVLQLTEPQQALVRPFAIPTPTRQLIVLTNKQFVRRTMLDTLVGEIRQSVPKEMLKLKGTQQLV